MIDFSEIYQLKGLVPKNKGQTNFEEHFDLTEKVHLTLVLSDGPGKFHQDPHLFKNIPNKMLGYPNFQKIYPSWYHCYAG